MSTDKTSRRSREGGHPPTVSVEELHQRLTDAIGAIETGDQWRDWLDFAQRLHKYSFNNAILIWIQRPDASAVASYQTWQALHRQVRRGEKAIRVLAPMIRRSPVLDEHGRPVLQPDGTKAQRQQIVGFRPVPVFDIAQTDGPPPPQAPRPALLAGQAPPGLWDALADEINQRGYRLLRASADQLGGANGVTKVVEREVWVRDDVDDAHAVKTLTHELAHVILHADPDQPVDCRGIPEVEAESVAHLVMAAHGVDSDPYSFPYVATWAYPIAAVDHIPLTDVVTRTGTRVIQTAHDILDAIPAAAPDVAGAALTARVQSSADGVRELREQVQASVLPAVERATLLGVVADSQDFYLRRVAGSWVPDYLADRNLARAIDSHGLGFAPGGWTTLTDHLRGLGYTDDHIEAAGMATRARTGQLVDRFRDRLTIPLRDQDGDLVGFTARHAPDVEDPRSPKYLNSPTTAIFHKHDILFGLTEHAERLTAGAVPVVTEGPLDAIAVDLTAQDQLRDWVGVATVGTAFTDQHTQRLLTATSSGRICLAFDGDPAGYTATDKAWRKLTEHQPVDVSVAALPDGSDPASMVRVEPWTLTRSIADAAPAATVIAGRQIDDTHLGDHVGAQVSAFRSLCRLVDRIPADQRPGFLLDLARRLHIDPGDAATITAEQNPGIVMDRIADRAQLLTATLTASARIGDHDQPLDRADTDHLARAITTRR